MSQCANKQGVNPPNTREHTPVEAYRDRNIPLTHHRYDFAKNDLDLDGTCIFVVEKHARKLF
jgi:hypothetical protein